MGHLGKIYAKVRRFDTPVTCTCVVADVHVFHVDSVISVDDSGLLYSTIYTQLHVCFIMI